MGLNWRKCQSKWKILIELRSKCCAKMGKRDGLYCMFTYHGLTTMWYIESASKAMSSQASMWKWTQKIDIIMLHVQRNNGFVPNSQPIDEAGYTTTDHIYEECKFWELHKQNTDSQLSIPFSNFFSTVQPLLHQGYKNILYKHIVLLQPKRWFSIPTVFCQIMGTQPFSSHLIIMM